VEIVDLRVTRSERLLERAYRELYLQVFTNPDEQEDLEQYRQRLFGPQQPIPQPITHFLVAGENLGDPESAQILAIQIFELYRESSCGLLTYTAVAPNARGKKLSRTIVRAAIEILTRECLIPEGLRAVFAEVHDPERVKEENDSMPPQQRLQVMRRLGARRVPVRYVQPILGEGKQPSEDLLLIAFPIVEGESIRLRGADLLDFLDEFYRALGVESPAADPAFQATRDDVEAAERATIRPEILTHSAATGLEPISFLHTGHRPQRNSGLVLAGWWALAIVWFLAFPSLMKLLGQFLPPVPRTDAMTAWGWRDATYYGLAHAAGFLANVVRGAVVFIILGWSYRLPYLFLVHSTFPNDEPLRPQWSWSIVLRPLASLRRLIEMLFYYRNMVSLSAVRRFLYVATHPVFSRRVLDLRPDRIFRKLQVYFETELFRPQLPGESNGEYGEVIGNLYCSNVHTLDRGITPVANCKTCFDVFGTNGDRIERYFKAQIRVHRDPSFLSRVTFDHGYLAPAHLVSGLLSEFDEDWTKIVNAYPEKLQKLASGTDSLTQLPDLRKLQSFIWDCWIQWGPSVPITNTDAWCSGESALQYGYGDENNSLPIRLNRRCAASSDAGENAYERQLNPAAWAGYRFRDWEEKIEQLLSGGLETTARAWPVRAGGRLRWLMRRDRNSRACLAQRTMNPSNKGWLVLDADQLEADPGQPRFYSAYIWVIMAICRETPSGTIELAEKDPADQWRCLIPFFQHGNVAEPSVFDSIKRELAEKTLGIILHELERADEAGVDWLRFHYVAAYDGSSDGSTSLCGRIEESKSVRGYLLEAMRRRATLEPAIAGRIGRVRCDQPVPGLSASDLPHLVRTYLDHIEHVT